MNISVMQQMIHPEAPGKQRQKKSQFSAASDRYNNIIFNNCVIYENAP